jgi:flagellar biosynthetic protein FliO
MTRKAAALAALAWAACARAQGELPDPGRGTAYYLLQALISLALVVGLICASYYLLRRLQERTSPARAAVGVIEVIDSRALGGGRWLYLVRVGEEHYLVGGSASGVGPIERTGLRVLDEAPGEVGGE